MDSQETFIVEHSWQGFYCQFQGSQTLCENVTHFRGSFLATEQEIVFQCINWGSNFFYGSTILKNKIWTWDPSVSFNHLNRFDYINRPNSPRPQWFPTGEEPRRLSARSQSKTGILPVQSPCMGPLVGFSWTVNCLVVGQNTQKIKRHKLKQTLLQHLLQLIHRRLRHISKKSFIWI